MKKAILPLLMLVVLFGCDRRKDPDVDPASTGSSTPPGERVDSSADNMANAAADDTAQTRQAPEFNQVPPTATQCEGKIGDELASCLQNRDQRNASTQTPPASAPANTPADTPSNTPADSTTPARP